MVKSEIAQVQALLSANPPQSEKAIELLKKMEGANHKNVWVVYYFLGIAYMQLSLFEQAVKSLEEAQKRGGNGPEVKLLLSEAYLGSKNYEEAESILKKLLNHKEDHVIAWKNLGRLYFEQDNYEDAVLAYSKANKFNSSDLDVALRIGKTYFESGNSVEAIKTYDSILNVANDFIEALVGKAECLLKLDKAISAKQILELALSKNNQHRRARRLYAATAVILGDFDTAIQLLEQLLSEDDSDTETALEYSKLISTLGFFGEAEELLTKILDSTDKPEKVIPAIIDIMLHNPTRKKEDIENELKKLATDFPAVKGVEKSWDFDLKGKDQKIRIGFISDTLYNHPEGWMAKAIIEHLPKSRFSIFCYNTCDSGKDVLVEQLSKHCSLYTFVSTMSPKALAKQIEYDDVDILVDLTTHYVEKIHKALFEKPAPSIIKWDKSASNYREYAVLDYVISRTGYDSPFAKNEMHPPSISVPETERVYARSEFVQPDEYASCKFNGYITFGNFNDPGKLNAQVLYVWANIMQKLPESKLLLRHKAYKSQLVRDNIKGQFVEFGIDEERIQIDPVLIQKDKVKGFNTIDIYLDTFPMSDGYNVAESLLMGVPVVSHTQTGVGSSGSDILKIVGLEEFVVTTYQDFVTKTVELARSNVRLDSLRKTLPELVKSSPLMDHQRFVAHFSKAMETVWQQRLNGDTDKEDRADIFIPSLNEAEYKQFLDSFEIQEVDEDTASGDRIFSNNFWNQYPNKRKTDKVVQVTNRFFTDEFADELLGKVIEETEQRMTDEPTDNLAFFIQSRALEALKPENKIISQQFDVLDEALQKKDWWHKRAVYSYWFEKVEQLQEGSGEIVSAIIIANKFKQKSVENFKRLYQQLKGIGEIIFVNNGLADEAFNELMPYITTYVKANGNAGAYLARNLGSVFSKGEYLIFVDDDGIPDQGFISAHLKEHRSRNIVVSRGMYYSGDVTNDPWHYNMGNKVIPACTILEGNAFYLAEAFYQAGGWGDYILFGHGGKDLSYRLLSYYPNEEQQIYTPNSRLRHEYFRGDAHKNEKKIKQNVSLKLLESLHPGLIETIDNWPTRFSQADTSKERMKKRDWPVLSRYSEKQFIHFCRNHVYTQVISDLIEEINLISDQKHWLLVEKTPWSAGNGYSINASENSSTLFFDSLNKNDVEKVAKTTLHQNVQAVFLHGIFRPWEFLLLDKLGDKKHFGWVIWGGDLYHPIQMGTPDHFKVDKISSIHTLGEGDIELFHKHFGPREVVRFGYPYPGLYGKTLSQSEPVKQPRIIVGNSGDASNNHIGILKALEAKSDILNYEIVLPVSYNFMEGYKHQLVSWIRQSNLAGKVTLQTNFLKPEEYFRFIAGSHLVVTAHHRQQAVGNMLMAAYAGVKTVLRDQILVNDEQLENPTWSFFRENELDVTSYNDFYAASSISELGTVTEETRERHQNIVREKFGLKPKADEWISACSEIMEMKKEAVS